MMVVLALWTCLRSLRSNEHLACREHAAPDGYPFCRRHGPAFHFSGTCSSGRSSRTTVRTRSIFMFAYVYTRNGDWLSALKCPKLIKVSRNGELHPSVRRISSLFFAQRTNGRRSNTNYLFIQTLLPGALDAVHPRDETA
ncbi:hypothetical protein EV401DRAFT_2003854 [Pisolithus croceorrhizus]|nr:hypothetical protein EV401DRAFT_2003854 [Pisolithus croceorrhizus]